MPLTVSRHPLVADSLAGLRDKRTDPEEFRVLARNVITMLLYEATADLPVRRGTVETPLREADALMVATEVVAIPVLRAGLGLAGAGPHQGGRRRRAAVHLRGGGAGGREGGRGTPPGGADLRRGPRRGAEQQGLHRSRPWRLRRSAVRNWWLAPR